MLVFVEQSLALPESANKSVVYGYFFLGTDTVITLVGVGWKMPNVGC